MSGTESAKSVGVEDLDFVYQNEKTYWNGSGRIRDRAFLCRRDDDRWRSGDGLFTVLSSGLFGKDIGEAIVVVMFA